MSRGKPEVSPEEVVLLGFFNELPRPATEEDEFFEATVFEVRNGERRLRFSWYRDRTVEVELTTGNEQFCCLVLNDAMDLQQTKRSGREVLQVNFATLSLSITLQPLHITLEPNL